MCSIMTYPMGESQVNISVQSCHDYPITMTNSYIKPLMLTSEYAYTGLGVTLQIYAAIPSVFIISAQKTHLVFFPCESGLTGLAISLITFVPGCCRIEFLNSLWVKGKSSEQCQRQVRDTPLVTDYPSSAERNKKAPNGAATTVPKPAAPCIPCWIESQAPLPKFWISLLDSSSLWWC